MTPTAPKIVTPHSPRVELSYPAHRICSTPGRLLGLPEVFNSSQLYRQYSTISLWRSHQRVSSTNKVGREPEPVRPWHGDLLAEYSSALGEQFVGFMDALSTNYLLPIIALLIAFSAAGGCAGEDFVTAVLGSLERKIICDI
jgi:hypothetical protein